MSLGKLIYFFIFIVFRTHLFLIFGLKVKCWCRNSIYENYFSFMKSDLDISVWIKDEAKVLQTIKKIRAINSFYLIIKEINFYFSSAPLNYGHLINPLELNRDPILELQLGKKSSPLTLEQRESYLLHMYFAEFKTGSNSTSSRSKKKWKYHLNRALTSPLSASTEITNYTQLLEIILTDYFGERAQRYIAAANELKSPIPLHELILKSEHARELLTLFPEKFCFAIDQINYLPKEEDRQLLVEQIKWEVWAMLTQPWLFSDHQETTFRHLENLKQILLRFEPECDLIVQIESLTVYMREILSDR